MTPEPKSRDSFEMPERFFSISKILPESIADFIGFSLTPAFIHEAFESSTEKSPVTPFAVCAPTMPVAKTAFSSKIFSRFPSRQTLCVPMTGAPPAPDRTALPVDFSP